MTTVEVSGWVELAELLCPGCRDVVSAEPPSNQEPGEEPAGWSHRDGSPLCGQRSGGPAVEPVEHREPR